MKRRTTIAECDICKQLSSHNYADLTYASIPEKMAVLVGTNPTDRPADDIIQCPICGTFYSYIYTCGFGENDIMLRRITPIEAGREVDVDNLKQDITDTHDETRAYAAQSLVEYYLSKGFLKDVDDLINSEDAVIRSNAEASRRYYLYRKNLE